MTGEDLDEIERKLMYSITMGLSPVEWRELLILARMGLNSEETVKEAFEQGFAKGLHSGFPGGDWINED